MGERNEKLINARNKLGLTQKQVAERAGLKVRTYAAYERKERFPRPDNAIVLARILKSDIDIFYGKEAHNGKA